MNTHKTNMVALALATVVFGCDERIVDDPVEGDVSWRKAADNGMRMNGKRINGMRMNGMRMNGEALVGDTPGDSVTVVGVDLPVPEEMAGVSLANGTLSVLTTSGTVLTGPQLSNTAIKVAVTEGGVTSLREVWVGAIVASAAQPGLWLYAADLWDAVAGWQAACTDGDGHPTEAILLSDVWDPQSGDRITPRPAGALTLACRGAALAKCVEFGYAPWKTQPGVSMADYHQACTRMVRADYCGDGVPHTVNGTKIHVLDEIGVQKADPDVDYVVEAEWGPDGAVCLNPNNTRLADQSIGCQIPTCGASFASGGLLQSGKVLAP